MRHQSKTPYWYGGLVTPDYKTLRQRIKKKHKIYSNNIPFTDVIDSGNVTCFDGSRVVAHFSTFSH